MSKETQKIPQLIFYEQPFHKAKYVSWVYDKNHNFVFQIEAQFNEQGNYADGWKEFEESIILSLNALERTPVPGLKLELQEGILLFKDSKLLIKIRGWGNLTGVGAHNFSGEKATKIQDDFVKWLLYRLCE